MAAGMRRRCHNLLQDYGRPVPQQGLYRRIPSGIEPARLRKKQWQEAIALLTEAWHADADSVTVNCAMSACAAAYRWKEVRFAYNES